MRTILIGICATITFSGAAFAANPLTSEQLIKSVQESVKDYSNIEPDMSSSISGIRVVTIGANAQVTIEMKTDGMNMAAKYLCVAQGANMACRLQQ